MNEPLISVIVVVYNAKGTISSTLKSIVEQDYKNIEIIIIDGKSTDGTIEIINSYSNKIDVFISEKDEGVYDAMNKGIDASKGKWLFFLGSDDVFINKTILSSIFSPYVYSAIDFLYGDVVLTSNRKIYGGEKNYMSLVDKNICHQSIFYKRTVFEKLGKYNLKYKILGDYDLNLRVFKDTSLQKCYLKKVVSLYNNKGLSSYVLDYTFHAHVLNIFAKNKENLLFIPELQQHHFYYGIINLYRKNILVGAKHIFTSWVCGKRKIFYFLFTAKFLLRILAFQKIKIK